ncbi:casein kinase family protein [Coccidioides immitis RMSCC 2394]|uniref:Casein kinase family protein n=1 Tax=Coccidioides immitis RMSCC 2394 TaxID=404692 RepID=A0A0J6YNY4_COCIT|nr:casein kinase family protein [Coccidioides immitis RMSCC 2394]
MAFSNIYGDYEVRMPMTGLAEVYLAFQPKHESFATLQACRGVPQLLWSETVPAHTVIVTDVYRPTLGAIYKQAGRRLGLDLILSLGEQLLSRLEWIHSRSISHGNLTPEALAGGAGGSWQSHQLFITDFQCAKRIDEPSAIWPAQQADLKALGAILIYLLGSCDSWDEFQKEGIPEGAEIPALITTFCECHLQVEKIGKEICLPADDAPGLRLLRSLSEVMELYMSILLQKRMTRQHLLPKPYDLPSRLWRDLRWYLAAVADMTVDFQKVVIEMIYGFMAALSDVVPCYRLHWLGNLITLADERGRVDTDNTKEEALKRAKWGWREHYNTLEVELMPMSSPQILS